MKNHDKQGNNNYHNIVSSNNKPEQADEKGRRIKDGEKNLLSTMTDYDTMTAIPKTR